MRTSVGQLPTAARHLPTDSISPTTVQGVLAARIDRLAPEEKALLQQLAVIGREFPLSLLRQVITQPEEELYRLLSSLQRKEFLYEQPAFPEVEYIFKHALTQEVAYSSVLQERRKCLHEQTAQAIEALYSATLEDHYSELAHHYSRSGNTEKAVEYLRLAGQQAVQRSANAEAISHLTAALELLKTLPDTPERAQQELALQLDLGRVVDGHQRLCRPGSGADLHPGAGAVSAGGETPQLFPVLWDCGRFMSRGRSSRQRGSWGSSSSAWPRGQQDPALLLEAHYALGVTLFFLGEFAPARAHLEQGIALYDPQQHRSHAFLYGQEPGVVCLSYAAWALWYLGYPDQALKRSPEALTLAQELSHPFSLAYALSCAAMAPSVPPGGAGSPRASRGSH